MLCLVMTILQCFFAEKCYVTSRVVILILLSSLLTMSKTCILCMFYLLHCFVVKEKSQRRLGSGFPNSKRLESNEYKKFFELDDGGDNALRRHKWKLKVKRSYCN